MKEDKYCVPRIPPIPSSIQRLPKSLLERASLEGNEYAWPIADIPKVIEAAKNANLINIGGQLQFRVPDKFGGGICECYWVEVDTYKSVPCELPWDERVTKTADAALSDFENLKAQCDFLKEGWISFEKHLIEAESLGGVAEEMMCFVWYTHDYDEEEEIKKSRK